ncbi:unnamed protein product [Dicrocoelium dendriticum]|nr:unnamed protein product [Dicrocoelium dendriticum]
MQCDWRDTAVQLASLICAHKGSIVVYTGAGISTATSIPDYRGTNGLWMYQKRARTSGRSRSRPNGNKSRDSNVLPKPENTGKLDAINPCLGTPEPTRRVEVHTKLRLPEATTARPTFTHMAIKVLVEQGYVSLRPAVFFH